MLYAVGTHIDLRDMSVAAQPERRPRLYIPGTRILFVQMMNELTVLKITRPGLARSIAAGA